MSFTSLEYAVFFALFFVLYWFVFQRDLKRQNALILVGSYLFYGWWDWRFLLLIFVSSAVDFLVGQGLEKTENNRRRKVLLWVSLGVNLGMLGFFKYFNFFVDSFKAAFSPFVEVAGFSTLDIILPVGISFYTLQTLSYTIDVYRKKIPATDQLIDFFAYVSFFPQLVAGPIERAKHLLPQFGKERRMEYAAATDGLRQITWGLFKKMVVADNCAIYTDYVFDNYAQLDGSTLFLGMIVFGFQIYADFSGYSDIAIGSARLLGFQLTKNFDYPIFSRTISEFWRKWHISLITWINDYLIAELKGRTRFKLTRNIFVVFLVTGLWHGANWTYICWGLVHAIYFIPLIYGKRKKYHQVIANGRLLPQMTEMLAMVKVFMLSALSSILFRSPSMTDAYHYFSGMLHSSLVSVPAMPRFEVSFIVVMMGVEWLQRTTEHGLDFDELTLPAWQRWTIYLGLILLILWFGGQPSEFIYFQF